MKWGGGHPSLERVEEVSPLSSGLGAGELHQGKLNVSRHNASQGAVMVQTLPGHSAVLIRDRQAMNRAIDGDVVVARVASGGRVQLAQSILDAARPRDAAILRPGAVNVEQERVRRHANEDRRVII